MYIYTYIHIATYRYVHTYLRTFVLKYHVCICVCICMHARVHIIVHAHVNHLFTHWLLYVRVRVFEYATYKWTFSKMLVHIVTVYASPHCHSVRMYLPLLCTHAPCDYAQNMHGWHGERNTTGCSEQLNYFYSEICVVCVCTCSMRMQTYVASSTPATTPSWRPPILSFGRTSLTNRL